MLSEVVQSEAGCRAECLQCLVSPQSFSEFQLQTRLPGVHFADSSDFGCKEQPAQASTETCVHGPDAVVSHSPYPKLPFRELWDHLLQGK